MANRKKAVAGPAQSVRARLEGLLAHLERRTEKVDRDLSRADAALSPDFAEAAVTLENDEVLAALSREGRDQISLVRDALARLDDGTYGDCETCGARISPARLEALPYATTCLSCARAAEAARG